MKNPGYMEFHGGRRKKWRKTKIALQLRATPHTQG